MIDDNVTGGDEAGFSYCCVLDTKLAGSWLAAKRANPQAAMPPSHRSRLLYGVGDTAFLKVS